MVLDVVRPLENALHEQALLNGSRVDLHPNNLGRTGAKHLQSVKAVVCSKIENSATGWDGHVLGQHIAPTLYAEIRIPNRPPPDSGARIEGSVHGGARRHAKPS